MHTWFIAEGQLSQVDAQGDVRIVTSPFVQEAVQRAERSRQVDAWKTGMEPDMGSLWLHGRKVALSELRYDSGRGGGLVPTSWELVCQNRKGQEHVAARHVVSFDVASDDSVIYSNGFELFKLVDGDCQSIARGHLVENVLAA